MGLFGKKDDEKDAENAALRAEAERLDALSLPALAEEVLARGFGADGPGETAPIQAHHVVALYDPAQRVFGADDEAKVQLALLVREGLQVLDRAGLVVWEVGGDHATTHWRPTRLGRRALADGTVAQLLVV